MKKDNEITIRSSAAEYLTYVAATGSNAESIEMRYEDENIWLTQKMMATLYDVETNTINYHIKKVFEDSELEEDSVIRKFRITAEDGKTYNTNHYNLQMIIAVGFKVNNERAIQFRKWANSIVKDYTIQGWVMDDERLKNGGSVLTEKYFEHLLERIREIRLSERRFYQKITDIYATALDYDKSSKTTKQFFANVQNKLHWAIHQHTAAELIMERADSEKPHMGLTSWENYPDGKIQKYDVSIAKNYLAEDELQGLRRIVTMYLDYAEHQASRRISMTMEDWADRLNRFLEFNGHRKIEVTDELVEHLKEIVEDLIIVKKVDTFLFGSKSQFDKLCLQVVTELKKKYPHIRCIYVRAEFPYIDEDYTAYLLQRYDHTYYPERIINAGKAAYVERNYEMIDNSSYCVIYYDENYIPPKRKNSRRDLFEYQPNSGTKRAYEYANRKAVNVVNVLDRIE